MTRKERKQSEKGRVIICYIEKTVFGYIVFSVKKKIFVY